jgi:hypothetical protein
MSPFTMPSLVDELLLSSNARHFSNIIKSQNTTPSFLIFFLLFCLKFVMEDYMKQLEFKSSMRRTVKANYGFYPHDSWHRHAMKKLECLDTESPQPNNDTPKTSCPRKPSLDCCKWDESDPPGLYIYSFLVQTAVRYKFGPPYKLRRERV